MLKTKCQSSPQDFSKEAFDTVPHRRLLNKLNYYGVLHRISSWLTKQHQRVFVDGETPDVAPVRSGVPQGTVPGPLMFLTYTLII